MHPQWELRNNVSAGKYKQVGISRGVQAFEARHDCRELIKARTWNTCVRGNLNFIFKGAKDFNKVEDFRLLISMDHYTGCNVGKKRLWMRTSQEAAAFLIGCYND